MLSIGTGPWYNAKGEKIADDSASLHSDKNNLTKQTALNERAKSSTAAVTRRTATTF
jgi:hypothetical protein